MNVEAFDCSPLPVQPTPDEAEWLRGLASRFQLEPVCCGLGQPGAEGSALSPRGLLHCPC